MGGGTAPRNKEARQTLSCQPDGLKLGYSVAPVKPNPQFYNTLT